MANEYLKFPTEEAQARLERYKYNDLLFEGRHFDAFSVKIKDPRYNRDYYALKYIVGNFAGLISKVCADMLFGEPASFSVDKGDQGWLEDLIFENQLHTQNYESALANSRHGDAVFKIRSGLLNPGDKDMTVIIEDISPQIYFPVLNSSNIRERPRQQELCWKVSISGKEYLRKEIHEPGLIRNELWLLDGDKVTVEVDIKLFDSTLLPTQKTNIERSLVVHVPNWRDGSRYFGYDDYSDLNSLFYGLNNRMTKTENILDKHSDPILALPEGVLDEEGNVKKEAFNMFEIPTGVGANPAKPEYITWNASLESSFKQIDKITELLYQFSETSPDVFGMGDNKAESGKALKLRMMRTIAKVSRKKLYYSHALKEVLFVAQEFARANKLKVRGNLIKKESIIPEIVWSDGLPIDDRETLENEQLRLEAGLTTLQDSLIRLDGLDEETAKKKVIEIQSENTVSIPSTVPKMSDEEST